MNSVAYAGGVVCGIVGCILYCCRPKVGEKHGLVPASESFIFEELRGGFTCTSLIVPCDYRQSSVTYSCYTKTLAERKSIVNTPNSANYAPLVPCLPVVQPSVAVRCCHISSPAAARPSRTPRIPPGPPSAGWCRRLRPGKAEQCSHLLTHHMCYLEA